MKIADVKVTIWEWKNIPPTRYTLQVKSSGTRTAHMALVRNHIHAESSVSPGPRVQVWSVSPEQIHVETLFGVVAPVSL